MARESFGSGFGVLVAMAGSAVGLGNLWRFPYLVGTNGGAAFIIIYLAFVLLLAMPIMYSEFIIGRRSQANVFGAYKVLAPNTKWCNVGLVYVLASLCIISFYCVVGGWTLDYFWKALTFQFSTPDTAMLGNMFNATVTSSTEPLVFMLLFLLVTALIVMAGIKDGIERYTKVMMPILFVIVIIVAIRSVTLPGAAAGLEFLFRPDFSKVTANTILDALGQAFFSLSLGMGCLSTYASYFGSDTQMGKTALSVGVIDTMVAILAGLIIFPAAFSVGIQPDAGPSLIFITLPNVFQQAFGGVPFLAMIFSLMFYVLLALAALTSTISLHEVVTAYLNEQFGMSRGRAAVWVTGFCVVTGVLSSLSLGVWDDKFFGLGFFDLLDFVTAKLMLPLSGLLVSLFVGWYLKRSLSYEELTNYGLQKAPYFPIYMFILRYLAPIAIVLIFVNELGWLS